MGILNVVGREKIIEVEHFLSLSLRFAAATATGHIYNKEGFLYGYALVYLFKGLIGGIKLQ